MPVYSMTGFASMQTTVTDPSVSTQTTQRLSVEIRSVNSRFLDLSFRMGDELRQFEPMLRELLNANLRRGKVELRAQCISEDTQSVPEPNVALLQRLGHVQSRVLSWLPDASPLSVAEVLRMGGSPAPGAQALQQCLQAATQQTLSALQQARQAEGQRLADMLRDRVTQLQQLTQRAEPLIPQLVAQQQERFVQRWQDALANVQGGVSAEQAHERALTEATAYAIRIDVAEELSRLRSHLEEIHVLLGKGGELGKRLEFLIQELHREANTMGSKSASLELTRISVDMKVLIEQMREQVQNLE
jgi:uncharacterized protein (TIGR00255 family)